MNTRPALAILLLLSATGLVRGETWSASRVLVSGSDEYIWVMGASDATGKALPLVQIWKGRTGPDAGPPSLSQLLPPISGNPLCVAADGHGALRVLYADLTQVDYFAERPLAPGPKWLSQSQRAPAAWCGDAIEPVVYALVTTASIPPEPSVTSRDSSEDDTDDLLEPVAAAATPMPTTAYCLLKLHNGAWSRLDGPTSLTKANRAWLCARSGRVGLFSELDEAISFVEYNGTAWGETIGVPSAGKIQGAWAGYGSAGAVLVVAVGRTEERCEVKLLSAREDGEWRVGATLRENLEFLEIDSGRYDVGFARERIIMARASADGGVEFASTEIDGSEPVRFEPLSMVRPEVSPRGTIQETIALMVGLAVLTFVMWTRRQQLALPATVPQGMQIAAVWRRIMATMIDVAPAALIAVPWMVKAVPELSSGMSWEEIQRVIEQPSVEAKLMPIQYSAVLIYGVWCWVWELFTRATPGKMLFGCRVLGIDGNAATPRQVMLRNVCRILMVGIGPSGWIITIMMMGMLSRNRQRVGDLLAFTVVVEDAPPPVEDSFLGGPDDGPSV